MNEDDFLSRWSKRKRAVAEESEVPDVRETVVEREPETTEEEELLLKKLKLPVPETLKPGDDFSAFMADHVPGFLRKRALRVLWRSNPVLANLDGLNDYDEDFTSPELTQKVLATAYQVGRGFVSRVTQSDDIQEEAGEEELPQDMDEDVPESAVPSENQASLDAVVYNDDPEPPVRPRRMRFRT